MKKWNTSSWAHGINSLVSETRNPASAKVSAASVNPASRSIDTIPK
jgi:hypothetical protein